MANTIVSLITPTGRSGIGVIRLSGAESLEIVRKLVADKDFTPEPRTAHLRRLHDPADGEVIDEAIITYFQSPHSFTGEDVMEIGCHGSPVLLRRVVDICLRADGRMAKAGEFTLRALSNGRMNLAEAEAVRDLIDAQTTASARQAVRQLRGEFSIQLQPIKDELLNVIVVLESALEFVEDDLPTVQGDHVKTSLRKITSHIGKLAETFQAGRLIREGLRVALVGRPNVGKSSLFNALLGTDRSIVTEIAGTTRDQIRERFTIGDIPISLIDTAGLRQTDDLVESIGVERSLATMADADIVMVMLDASEQTTVEDREILASVKDLNYLVALNKIDKLPSSDIDRIIAGEHSSLGYLREKIIPISAKTGDGLDELRNNIIRPFAAEDVSTAGFLVTDARHFDLLTRAEADIELSIEQLEEKISEEIVLIGLHNALRYLGDITGETTTEDVLDRIFSTFCIGK